MKTHVKSLGDKYQPEIDGLRAVAVLAVVLNHYWPNFITGGFVGVDIFFVISGYIITRLVIKEIEEDRFNYLNFYIRRIKRILPALIAVLIVTLVFAQILMLNSDRNDVVKASLATILFGANFLYWKELQFGYFATMDTGIHPLVHTWSLSVEEQFYILYPVLVYIMLKLKNKIIFNAVAMILIILGIYISQLSLKDHSVAVFFLSPFRFWELFCGVLIAVNINNININKVTSEIFSLIGAILLIYSFYSFDNSTKFPGLNAVIPVAGACLIIVTTQAGGLLFKLNIINTILSVRILVCIGLISYSLYLIHWPLFSLYRYYDGLNELNNLTTLAILILSIVLSYLSFLYIEQKFRFYDVIDIKSFFKVTFFVVLSFIAVNLFLKNYFNRVDLTEIYNTYDEQRNPDLEYKNCDSIREYDKWCIIGDKSNAPSYLILGDSHLISWASAFNAALNNNKKSAIIAPFSACPPLINLISWPGLGCNDRSRLIKFLINNNYADHIILTGNWLHHFDANKNNTSISDNFEETIKLIISKKIKLTIIGAVPIYKKNVPLMLALESKQSKTQQDLIINIDHEKIKLNDFYNIISSYGDSELLNFYEPYEMLCSPVCKNSINNKSLYYDSNHLNSYGASLYVGDLTMLLKNN